MDDTISFDAEATPPEDLAFPILRRFPLQRRRPDPRQGNRARAGGPPPQALTSLGPDSACALMVRSGGKSPWKFFRRKEYPNGK